MRTKTLAMTAAALVAGVLASSAQVYSANVVGYVTKKFTTGNFTLVSTPLDAGTNDLNTLFQNVPDTTTVWIWSVADQDFNPVIASYSAGAKAWTPNLTVAPGLGYFVAAGADFTNTFVGNVLQGTLVNPTPIAGNGAFVAIASMVPVGGSLTNVMGGYTPTDTDQVWTWSVADQDFNPAVPTWSAGQAKWVPDADIPVGDGFFYVGANTTPKTWTRSFTVN